MAPQFSVNGTVNGEEEAGSPLPEDSFKLIPSMAKNRLLLIFSLLAVMALAFNIKLIVDVGSFMTTKDKAYEARSTGEQSAGSGDLTNSVTDLRNGLIVLFGILVICFASILYLFVRRVVIPLRRVIRATGEIAKGNLSMTVPACHGNEIAELSSLLNDLAVNFQEVMLLTGATVGNSSVAVEEIEKALNKQPVEPSTDLKRQVVSLKRDMSMLHGVVKSFTFYKADFNGRNVVPRGPKGKTRT